MMIGPEQGYIDPQMNNQPLSFNSNKGKPPMPVESSGEKKKSRKSSDTKEGAMPMPPMPPENFTPTSGANMPGAGMGPMMMPGGQPGFFGHGPMGHMGPMMGPMMGPGHHPEGMMPMHGNMQPMPGNMMMFGGMGWGPGGGPPMEEGMAGPMMPQKEILRKENCVLYPPPGNIPHPTTRERPPGCRTIFVGGLPENCSEEMLGEVFSEFGATTSVRKSKKKNFAHVRYEDESSVDRALVLSGYRMKVEDKDDKPNTGRLHVDFAMARDDQYEFECKQRAMMRDMRHRQRLEEERLRPPSPPPILQYSDYEASAILEKMKTDEDFMKASQVLLTWLDRGEVNRRNINTFYSLIQCVNGHIRRLLQEKATHEEELTKMKEKYRNIFEGILRQFDQIDRVFGATLKQRNWDHFTKAQRKNIELWNKQAKEIRQSQQDEFLSSRQEAEMEMSDSDDDGPSMKKRKSEDINHLAEMAIKMKELNTLHDENDALKCQLEAAKNEMEGLKRDKRSSKGDKDKDKELKVLQLAMQGMQQQLIQAKKEVTDAKKKAEVAELVHKKEMANLKTKNKSSSEKSEKSASEDTEKAEKDGQATEKQETSSQEDGVSSTGTTLSDKDMNLFGLVCCFLHVHPTGASIDYIWSYLHRCGIICRVSELETLLEKFPACFKQEVSGVGATIERRWHFNCYKNLQPT